MNDGRRSRDAEGSREVFAALALGSNRGDRMATLQGAVDALAETDGVDWIRWIISIIVAAILVVLVATLMGRNKRSINR